MNPMLLLIIAATAFVGTHFLLSHPLRAPLVRALGGTGFMILYSVVALVTLGGMAHAFGAAPQGEFFWPVGDGIWAVVTLVMLLASILLLGSFVRNPAFPGAPGVETAKGVFAITRHPMNWAFALWGLCHMAVFPTAKNFILTGAIVILALVGSALQDAKKAQAQPDFWPGWEAKTSFWPFAAIAAGRARLGGLGLHAVLGGILVWLAATWAHIPLAGWPAGIWRWL